MITKSKILLFLLLSFIGGVFARSFFEISGNYYFVLLIFSLVLFFLFYKNKLATLVAFILLAFFVGYFVTNKKIDNANNLVYLGMNFDGKVIVQKSTQSFFGQNVVVGLQEENIYLLLQAPQYPQYTYGDILQLNCTLNAIENKDASFDYRMYMAKEGVLYQCEKGKIEKVEKNAGSWIYAKIISAKKSFEDKIVKVIPMPEGALAIGLLFGGNAGLSKEIQKDFSITGMTHIVAVSGYNVTIVAEYLILLGIFLGLWRPQAIWFAIGGIVLFVVMAGLPASAVRAGVMSTVLLWAMKNGRLASSQNAIIFTGSAMLLLNPLLLRWDVGFQLSFLATLGIVATSSFWEKNFIKKNKVFGISEIIALSLSAQFFVLPIIVYNFKIVSLISLLANVLILPIIPLSMLIVFLVVIFGFIFTPLAIVFGWLSFCLLFYEIKTIQLLASFSWSSVSIAKIEVWWIVFYYIILAMLIMHINKSANQNQEKE
ncbi:MAG: ComEC/Rec2 family competence protein [bacterium]